MLRVIGGSAKGRLLRSVPGSGTRPPLARVRAAVFNIVQERLPGSRVLDLFAGTGSYAIEALSRGAEFAVAVDSSPQAIATMRHNLQATGFAQKARLVPGTIPGILHTLKGSQFDLIVVAPPYFKDLGEPTLLAISSLGLIHPEGVVVFQHDKRESVPERAGILHLHRTYTYGTNCISLYLVSPA
ncbi:MAG TPA: 16S rRNA (guanine(966)-N(2))-methyltransferase RsmD [Firmicutes bacterium]|nr:16S rRNA (guanine(966)-N(2))-methyltransferase RsmD [Bacillota bacterium]